VTACSADLKSKLPAPSTERLDLSVAIPAECKRLAGAVDHPVMRRDDDAELLIIRYAAALEIANGRIGAQAWCVADLRARYANYAARAARK